MNTRRPVTLARLALLLKERKTVVSAIFFTTVIILVLSLMTIAAPSPAAAAVASNDPNYTATLLTSGLAGPSNGVVYRASANDVLVAEYSAGRVTKVDALTGAKSLFANVTLPDEMAINSLGDVYVKEHPSGPIHRFDSNGIESPSFASPCPDPTGIAFDTLDNFYVACNGDGTIYRFLAGNFGFPTVYASGFLSLEGMAFSPAGDLFVANHNQGTIFKVTPGGTTPGAHTEWASGLSTPLNVAFDPLTGDVFASSSDTVVRIQSPVVTTFASGFTAGFGLGTYDLDFDLVGCLYVDDFTTGELWKFCPAAPADAVITTVAGTGVATTGETGGLLGDGGAATDATLNFPFGVARDGAGNVFVADRNNHRVRMINTNSGEISTVAGTGVAGYEGNNGPATAAQLNAPVAVAVDSTGLFLYIAEQGNHAVRKVDLLTGIITTVAGTLQKTGVADNGGLATDPSCLEPGGPPCPTLFGPRGVAIDAAGNIYIADTMNQQVRKVDVNSGNILTVAGVSGETGNNDGPVSCAPLAEECTPARLNSPLGVAVNAAGTVVYIADEGNDNIRVVLGGVVTSLLEPGSLEAPAGVATDAAGNVYIADTNNHRIVRVSDETVDIVAGDETACLTPTGPCGDGGPATAAQLNTPVAVAVDSTGQFLYIADLINNKIRKVDFGD